MTKYKYFKSKNYRSNVNLVVESDIVETSDQTSEGGIPDAPNNASAYVRSGLAWVVGYTKAAIDSLFGNRESFITPEQFGAVGDGVTDDSTAINNALSSPISNIIFFKGGKTYLVKKSLQIGTNKELIGYGATIKRGAEIKTTLSANMNNNSTTLTVVDASVFNVGDKIFVTDVTGVSGGIAGFDSSLLVGVAPNEGYTITNITGNVITVNTAFTLPVSGNLNALGHYPIGSVVIKNWNTFQIAGGITNIRGLSFDGNRAQNSGSVFWTVNKNIATLRNRSSLSDCTFYNMGSENVFLESNTIVTSCKAYDCNGSFVHVSDGTLGSLGKIIISDNIITDVCQSNITYSEHSEAVITFSANTRDIIIKGNHVTNINGLFCGYAFSDSDVNISILNNKVTNVYAVLDYLTRNSNLGYSVEIIGNSFIDCATLNFITSVSTVAKSFGFDRIIVSNNNFTNTQFQFFEVTNLQFSNNNITLKDGYTYPSLSPYPAQAFLISFTGANLSFLNNNFNDERSSDGGVWISNINLADGNSTTFVRSSIGVNTKISYWRNVKICGNNSIGFSNFFNCASRTAGTISYKYQGWAIEDNLITIKNNPTAQNPTTTTKAILCLPGMHVRRNQFFGNSTCLYAIWAMGLNSTDGAVLNGQLIRDNWIHGFNNSMRIAINNGGSPNLGYGIICTNNYISSSILDFKGTGGVVADNTTIIAETTEVQKLRENPSFY